jgi:hypothetical protein
MARYKPYDANQVTLIPVSFPDQVLPGSTPITLGGTRFWERPSKAISCWAVWTLTRLALPVSVLREHLEALNTTTKPDGTIYWHVKIVKPGVNQFALQLPRWGKSLPLEPFTLKLGNGR